MASNSWSHSDITMFHSIGDVDLYDGYFVQPLAHEAGRDPASLPVTIGGAPEDIDKLRRFRDLGAARVNVSRMSDARDDILPILDRWAGYIRQVRD
jgi:hypothetical protein